MSDYIISTERLGLRLWKPEDFIPFAEMNKDKDVMEFFPSLLADDETKSMIQRIENHFTKHGFGLYAVEEKASKHFIGYTGFMVPSFESFFTPCIEIGWRLHHNAWGKGYATEAAKACLQYGFATLQFDKVYSFTSVINTRSEKVMQKIGMQKIGEFNHPKIAEGDRLCRHVLYISSSNHFS
ncbi:MAG TPA: GNAT family N-acetyltransferase [Chitinophagaceae bacterium]|nr:GNAT family N-acetyltransferase [Chitinophagaceae bacterium]